MLTDPDAQRRERLLLAFGLDHHICFGDDANLNVSEVWDSRQQWETFRERLMPLLSEAGIEFSGEPDVFEVHDAIRR